MPWKTAHARLESKIDGGPKTGDRVGLPSPVVGHSWTLDRFSVTNTAERTHGYKKSGLGPELPRLWERSFCTGGPGPFLVRNRKRRCGAGSGLANEIRRTSSAARLIRRQTRKALTAGATTSLFFKSMARTIEIVRATGWTPTAAKKSNCAGAATAH
jgi:hypothetical protein